MPLIYTDAGPSLTSAFSWRVLAERQHARAKHRATAGQGQLAFDSPTFRQRTTPFFPLNLTGLRRPLARESREHDTDTDGYQREANRVRETTPDNQLLDGHNHAQPSHPGCTHHPYRKHHQHHRPTAAKTIDTLPDAKLEYPGRGGRPISEEKRERLLAARQAGVFKRGKLIEAGADEYRAGKQPVCRFHAVVEKCGVGEQYLDQRREDCENQPYGGVARGECEWRNNILVLARGGVGKS